jgi:hypothetical protein
MLNEVFQQSNMSISQSIIQFIFKNKAVVHGLMLQMSLWG